MDTIVKLQLKQQRVLRQLYGTHDSDRVRRAELNTEYDALRDELRKLLGGDAHCADVCPDTYEVYRNVYKSHYGFNPRCHVTFDKAAQYLA